MVIDHTHTHLLRLLVIVLIAAHVVRAAVAYPVGGGGGDVVGGGYPVGPVGLSSRGVSVGGGRRAVAGAVAEQLVRLGLQLLGMRRLLAHEGRLKRDRAESKGKAIVIRANRRRPSFRGPRSKARE